MFDTKLEQHIVPLRYARLKRWCSTRPMCATTISRRSLQTALISQLSSSFWPFSSTTPTFLCTSSTLPRFLWGDNKIKRRSSVDYTWNITLRSWRKCNRSISFHPHHYWTRNREGNTGLTGHLHKFRAVKVLPKKSRLTRSFSVPFFVFLTYDLLLHIIGKRYVD